MTYNRDLQEDKQQLMDAADTVQSVLEACAGMVSEMVVDASRASEAAADPALLATDVADRLVREDGVPFREAYSRVKARVLGELDSAEELPQLTALESVAMRDVAGGTAPARVSESVMRAYGELWAARLRGEW